MSLGWRKYLIIRCIRFIQKYVRDSMRWTAGMWW